MHTDVIRGTRPKEWEEIASLTRASAHSGTWVASVYGADRLWGDHVPTGPLGVLRSVVERYASEVLETDQLRWRWTDRDNVRCEITYDERWRRRRWPSPP